jgi:aspartyl-tRNA(Asn)/glutamyl-tRNA(Gln) amidotransferase subunit A
VTRDLIVAVKDNLRVDGCPTRAGTRDFDWPGEEAEAVRRMRAAGASFVANAPMDELAYGAAPDVDNPRWPDRICGGSSSGPAAAVAGGNAGAALGTDTGGSVRLPAAFTGIVGFKPTRGVIPTDGVVPLSWTLDHVGVLAPSVSVAVFVAGVAAARTWETTVTPPEALRLVVPGEAFLGDLDESVAAAFEGARRTLAEAGADVREVVLPDVDECNEAASVVIACEATEAHRALLFSPNGVLGPDVRRRLDAGALYSATDYLHARRVLTRAAIEYHDAVGPGEVVLSPTAPTVPPRRDERVPGRVRSSWIRATILWNAAGAPAISVPAGASLPIGLQIGGREDDDATVLGAALALEALIADG